MMLNEGLTNNLTADKGAGRYTGKRLLLVENSDLNQEIVAMILSCTGACVDAAPDTQEAVDRFAGAAPGTYHMIFMELELPVMSGFEAARSIRSLNRPDAGQIPILGLTGNPSAKTLRAAKEAGFSECLRTPLDTALLTEVMARYIRD